MMATWIGVIIAFLVFSFAIFKYVKQEKEKRKTIHISGKLGKEEGSKSDLLIVENSGALEVRNLRVYLDGQIFDKEHPLYVGNSPLLNIIGAHSKISCFMNLDMQNTPPSDLLVIWDDDYRKEREYRTILTW